MYVRSCIFIAIVFKLQYRRSIKKTNPVLLVTELIKREVFVRHWKCSSINRKNYLSTLKTRESPLLTSRGDPNWQYTKPGLCVSFPPAVRETPKSLSSHRPSSSLKFTEIHQECFRHCWPHCKKLFVVTTFTTWPERKAFSWEIRGVAERCLFLPHSGRFSELDSGKSRIRKIRSKPSISSGFSLHMNITELAPVFKWHRFVLALRFCRKLGSQL